jgi:tetratricopeptide (TPR) repeat protein
MEWRYADAGELAADLARCARGDEPRGAGPPAWQRALVHLRARPLPLAAAVVIVALAGLLVLGGKAAGADPLAAARALRSAKQFPQALAGYRGLLATRPEDAALWAEYARACHAAAEVGAGIEAVDRAIALAGAIPPLRNTKAALLDLGGRRAEAQELLRTLVAEHPDRSDYRFNLAHSLDSAGRVAEAAAGYREVLARDPGHQRARISLAWLHATAAGEAAALRDPELAVQLACEVLQADEGRDEALVSTIVLIAQKTGRPDAIADALAHAADASEDPARAGLLRRLAHSLR